MKKLLTSRVVYSLYREMLNKSGFETIKCIASKKEFYYEETNLFYIIPASALLIDSCYIVKRKIPKNIKITDQLVIV